jgi:hypothetical protein
VTGVPNFRQATKVPVWGGGQPTLSGIKTMMETLDEEGAQKLFWVSLRDTPVCYVGDMSFTAARREAIARPMVFDDISREELPTLDELFANKIKREIRATGGLMSYWKLALADVEDDVKRVEIVMEVDETKNEDEDDDDEKTPGELPVIPVADLFKPETGWAELNELDIQYQRLDIGDEKIPSVETLQAVHGLALEVAGGSGMFFQDQGGFLRTTSAMIIASLVRFLYEEPDEDDDDVSGQQQDDLAEEDDEEEDDEDLDEEEREARRQARAERRAREAKEKEEDEEEILPDYKKGEYQIIMDLVRALGPAGPKLKEEVDMIIDRCGKLVNLREVILTQKASGNTTKGQNFVERYFWYILFYHYLKSNMETEFETTLEMWLEEEAQKELLQILGTRQEGALSEFNFS